jgi:predicted DNA binding CopG/RHH family protein
VAICARAKTGLEPIQSLRQGDLQKDRRLNIRISTKDLEAIQKRALEEGLPYQTLIASLLHKYASGRLREA